MEATLERYMKMTFKRTNIKKTIKDVVTSCNSYRDDIAIMEFDNTSLYKLKKNAPLPPARFDGLILIGISDGEIDIQVDYVLYKINKNSILLILPTQVVCFINGNDNLKGWILIISRLFIEIQDYMVHRQVISYMQLKKNPLTVFDHDEYKSFCVSLNYIRNKMHQHTHFFQEEVMKLALQILYMDLTNMFLKKGKYHITVSLSRKEELFADFQALLWEHCKNNRNVKFYADKLCITAQYLSSILKEQSGKSASQLIFEALITEAKGLLKSPLVKIQQVSFELNFPDQSTFGKFFKKHTGTSPLLFRKSQ
jgi:AraC-type DNA-binding domain-containing proteins